MLNITHAFVTGGNATFTVDNGRGEHFTFKVRKPSKDKPYFFSVMTGKDNETGFAYAGLLEPSALALRITAKGIANGFPDDSKPVRVARWALGIVAKGGTVPEGYSIRHAGKCGCCGRKLTNPESLNTGIGPECAKKIVQN